MHQCARSSAFLPNGRLLRGADDLPRQGVLAIRLSGNTMTTPNRSARPSRDPGDRADSILTLPKLSPQREHPLPDLDGLRRGIGRGRGRDDRSTNPDATSHRNRVTHRCAH